MSPFGWPFELFVHFRPQYAVASLLLAVLLVGLGRWRPAAIALMLAALHAWPVVPSSQAGAARVACEGPGLSVATVNLWFRNSDPAALVSWLASGPADLVMLQEVTDDWASALVLLTDEYPYQWLLPREDPYGIGVISRHALRVASVDLAGDGLPSLTGAVEVDDRVLRFIGLHTHWPLLPGLARRRDAALFSAADELRAGDGPAVLLGDLNLSPHAPSYQQLLDRGGLRDVLPRRAWHPTWMAGFWPLALRIDHVLVSNGVCVETASIGPDVGSDHRPVIARLTLR
ncbi:MAG TPA: endonuclease/exonuclease/phosphatase family protein [Steroidobacteraceae bacterium]|nr:endonuclease/exonuclease/phosphatase family protein [Steroidobacteraceae bacterium]